MKPIMMLAAAAVSTALVLPTVSWAQARNDQQVVSEQVHYGDLNLASAESQAALQRRIGASIQRVCADNGAVDLKTRLGIRECVKLARKQTAQQVQLALAAKGNRARA